MCYVPFRPCVQGLAYRSATLKHVSEGIDRGRALPMCTIHEKQSNSNVNIQKYFLFFYLSYTAMMKKKMDECESDMFKSAFFLK